MTGPKLRASKADVAVIIEIVKRARRALPEIDGLSLSMDITAAHLNGCPLDLAKFLKAPLGSFLHDVGGITRHVNRSTGRLENHFLPRCAAPAVRS